MTSPIIDFIEARLAEDEQIARNASMGPVGGDREVWTYDRDGFAVRATHGKWNVATRSDDPADAHEIHMSDSHGEHIARHQPVRVLREVAAKRAILETVDPCPECLAGFRCVPHDSSAGAPSRQPATEEGERLLKLLAAPYSDHPDFDPNWSTT